MNDPVVGQFIMAYNGGIYYCDSHDPACGYWLTLVDRTSVAGAAKDRINISERAIDRTFHRIHVDGDRAYCRYGPVAIARLRVPAAPPGPPRAADSRI